jgi:hypothetical protein
MRKTPSAREGGEGWGEVGERRAVAPPAAPPLAGGGPDGHIQGTPESPPHPDLSAPWGGEGEGSLAG